MKITTKRHFSCERSQTSPSHLSAHTSRVADRDVMDIVERFVHNQSPPYRDLRCGNVGPTGSNTRKEIVEAVSQYLQKTKQTLWSTAAPPPTDQYANMTRWASPYSILSSCDAIALLQRYSRGGKVTDGVIGAVLRDLVFSPYTATEENKFIGLGRDTQARQRVVLYSKWLASTPLSSSNASERELMQVGLCIVLLFLESWHSTTPSFPRVQDGTVCTDELYIESCFPIDFVAVFSVFPESPSRSVLVKLEKATKDVALREQQPQYALTYPSPSLYQIFGPSRGLTLSDKAFKKEVKSHLQVLNYLASTAVKNIGKVSPVVIPMLSPCCVLDPSPSRTTPTTASCALSNVSVFNSKQPNSRAGHTTEGESEHEDNSSDAGFVPFTQRKRKREDLNEYLKNPRSGKAVRCYVDGQIGGFVRTDNGSLFLEECEAHEVKRSIMQLPLLQPLAIRDESRALNRLSFQERVLESQKTLKLLELSIVNNIEMHKTELLSTFEANDIMHKVLVDEQNGIPMKADELVKVMFEYARTILQKNDVSGMEATQVFLRHKQAWMEHWRKYCNNLQDEPFLLMHAENDLTMLDHNANANVECALNDITNI